MLYGWSFSFYELVYIDKKKKKLYYKGWRLNKISIIWEEKNNKRKYFLKEILRGDILLFPLVNLVEIFVLPLPLHTLVLPFLCIQAANLGVPNP